MPFRHQTIFCKGLGGFRTAVIVTPCSGRVHGIRYARIYLLKAHSWRYSTTYVPAVRKTAARVGPGAWHQICPDIHLMLHSRRYSTTSVPAVRKAAARVGTGCMASDLPGYIHLMLHSWCYSTVCVLAVRKAGASCRTGA